MGNGFNHHGSAGVDRDCIGKLRSVVAKIRRTARGHCFRWLGNCCATNERKSRGRMYAADQQEDANRIAMAAFTGKSVEAQQEEAKREMSKQEKEKHFHPPPPPRFDPPPLHQNDWLCSSCNFYNYEEEHPYVHSCAQCGKRRTVARSGSRMTLADKKRALGLEVSLLKNVLLAKDAQFAAVSWGIEDHSTTLRETYWLVHTIDLLGKQILEDFFNMRQLSIRTDAQEQHATAKSTQ